VVDHGESLSSQQGMQLALLVEPRERAFAQELTFGTLRWFHRLDAILGRLLAKPLKRKDHDVRSVLLVGLYQLLLLDTPGHAAVGETVEAARQTGKAWAVKLVNGVLRSAQRQAEALQEAVNGQPAARWSHPQWWIDQLQRDWPDHWQSILDAGNQRPPMVLRVNRSRSGRTHYSEQLQQVGIEAWPLDEVPDALQLATPVSVDRLPGFSAGLVSVQDGAAQLSASLLQMEDGQTVLDACAAPGGKTCHILEMQPGLGRLVALDNDPRRLEKVKENLDRLQLSAELVAADAGTPESWWDGSQFDRILLDAPCSASGVVRRHPDIKLLRRAEDLPALCLQQQRLLDALWPLLTPGGILLYVTCSVFRRENEEGVKGFLASHADASELPLEVNWGIPQSPGRQILPAQHGMDGFYFARLIKVSATHQ
jgi:16S rRNA (cytosine967-C5)-methyltransferase